MPITDLLFAIFFFTVKRYTYAAVSITLLGRLRVAEISFILVKTLVRLLSADVVRTLICQRRRFSTLYLILLGRLFPWESFIVDEISVASPKS